MKSFIFEVAPVIFVLITLIFIILKLVQIYKYRENNVLYLEAKGKTDKLIKVYNKILAKTPENNKIRIKLAKTYEKLNMIKEACNEYIKLVKYDSSIDEKSGIETIKKVDNLYKKLSNQDSGFRFFLDIYKDSLNNKYYTKHMGLTLLREGVSSFAKVYLESLLPTEDTDIIKALIYVYTKTHDYKSATHILENIYRVYLKKNIHNPNIENLLIALLLKSENFFKAKTLIENILYEKRSEIEYFIKRAYLFTLYKINDKKKFINYYDDYKKSLLKQNSNFNLDLGFYSYFLKNFTNSVEYFKSFEKEFGKNNDKINVTKCITFVKKINEINSQYRYTQNKISKSNKRGIKKTYKEYIKEDESFNWDSSIIYWENSINIESLGYADSLFDIKPTFDIQRVIREEGFKLKGKSEITPKNESSSRINRLFSIPFSSFTNICKSIIRYQLKYFIEKEIKNEANKYGDGVDYLVYSQNSNTNSITLIGFRRWKSETIGELALRDFALSVHEHKAKNGILLVPVELSKSAQNYLANNTLLKVYSKREFDNLLRSIN